MKLIAITLVALTLPMCERSRADYRDDVASAVCAQMQQCGKIAPDGKYANSDDCVTDVSARYNKMWSAKRCEAKIDPEAFERCKTRAVGKACHGNVLDDLSFKIECGANDVCIAEPPQTENQ